MSPLGRDGGNQATVSVVEVELMKVGGDRF